MSRTYRLRLAEDLVIEVDACAEGKVVHRIELQPILSAEVMRRILVDSLVRRGWNRGNDEKLRTTDSESGEKLTLDPEKMTLEASIQARKKIQTTITEAVVEDTPDLDESRAPLDKAALERIRDRHTEKIGQQAEREAKEDANRAIFEGAKKRIRDIQVAINDVYAEALKQKARTMGTVTEIREETGEDGRYRLTIKVAE